MFELKGRKAKREWAGSGHRYALEFQARDITYKLQSLYSRLDTSSFGSSGRNVNKYLLQLLGFDICGLHYPCYPRRISGPGLDDISHVGEIVNEPRPRHDFVERRYKILGGEAENLPQSV